MIRGAAAPLRRPEQGPAVRLAVPSMQGIADHIYLLTGERNGRFPFSHSLLIRDKLTALIDAGCGPRTLKEIRETFRPDRIIYSHAHPDHCLGCGAFPSARIWGPREHPESTGDPEAMAVVSSQAGVITGDVREAFDAFLGVFLHRDRAILDFLRRPPGLWKTLWTGPWSTAGTLTAPRSSVSGSAR